MPALKSLFMLLVVPALLAAQVTMQTVRNMPANTWLAVPNSSFSSLDPCPSRNCSYSGVSGLAGFFHWSGGAYDTKRDRLVLWGGGHNDYRGNEIYVFDINTMIWQRLTDPTANPVNCGQTNGDGTPNSRHTWAGLAYIAHADRFFGSGGALNCDIGGCGADKTWTFNFDTKQWTDRLPAGTKPPTGCGNSCAYDSVSGKVFWADNNYPGNGAGLYSYNYNANQWTKHDSYSYYETGMAVDTKRGLLFIVGAGNVIVYAVGSNNFTRQTWSTTGATALVSAAKLGLEYDPVADKIVGWNGGAVYGLNPDTRVWTQYGSTGAPTAEATGTYGRWRYVPSVNAYIVANSKDDNVHFFKLTAGGGTAITSAPPSRPSWVSVFPNPARSFTRISFGVTAGVCKASIHDIRGRQVAAFPAIDGSSLVWRTDAIPAGVYLLTMEENAGKGETVRILIVK